MPTITAVEYKELCQRPDVFGRWCLEETLRLLAADSEETRQLRTILLTPPLPKPALHDGANIEDRFQIDLPMESVSAIVDELVTREAEAIGPEGETTAQASNIASLADVWNRYAEFKSAKSLSR